MLQRIQSIESKLMVGKRLRMSMSNNLTTTLWRQFMQEQKRISNKVSTAYYSIQSYDTNIDFSSFNPSVSFDKWAAVEVSTLDDIPEGMETCEIKGGKYAIFLHKGRAKEFSKTFHYIFATWLPNSSYIVDNRMHFEVLGDKYINDHPDSEEEIWIPIKSKPQ